MKALNAVLMVIGVLVLIVGCAVPQSSSEVPVAAPEVLGEESSTLAGETYQVTIENDAFGPTNLELKVGDKVEWVNQDDQEHTVTFDNGVVDELLPVGASASYTFNEAGEYNYHCKIHSGMQGKVIVG